MASRSLPQRVVIFVFLLHSVIVTASTISSSFDVSPTRVRRELRELSTNERKAFFRALWVMKMTPTTIGRKVLTTTTYDFCVLTLMCASHVCSSTANITPHTMILWPNILKLPRTCVATWSVIFINDCPQP